VRSFQEPVEGDVGDATVADAILDRLLRRTRRIELTGASLRRSETTAPRVKNQPK
jgi:hypothetical protein